MVKGRAEKVLFVKSLIARVNDYGFRGEGVRGQVPQGKMDGTEAVST